MTVDPMQPFDELPRLPPKGLESRAVMQQLLLASRALAALDAASRSLPDPSILINTIPLQEAQASSAIENIVTTQDALYRAAAATTESDDPATREALRYRTALQQASQGLGAKGFTLDLLVDACSTIKGEGVTFRDGGEFAPLRDSTNRIVYTPPGNAVVIPRLLENLEDYVQNNEADPLLKMAVAHYQFEAIHPFHDGNGRTGRIMNLLVLQHGGLLQLPILYLSKYIIENKEAYYALLDAVTKDGAWEPWILWMLEGVEITSRETLGRIERITALQAETEARIQREAPGLDRHGILRILFSQPYCKIGHLVDAGIAKRQTASVYLKELESLGILKGQKQGRELIYLHTALMQAVR